MTMIQVTSSLVVTSDKINACSVYTQQAYLLAARVGVAPRPRDQLNAKDADVTNVTTKLILTWSIYSVDLEVSKSPGVKISSRIQKSGTHFDTKRMKRAHLGPGPHNSHAC